MTLDPDRIHTITFDSFSTLVDIDSTAPAVEEYVDDPVSFARDWHTRAAIYGMVGNYIDTYKTYYDLHIDALEYLLAAHGVSVPPEHLEDMTAIYHEMEPFDDVRDEMHRLAAAGYDLGVISNGDPPMLESLVRAADIDGVLRATVSADEIKQHKPAVALYSHAADRLETTPDAMVHVSNAVFDVQGAMHAGYQGVWINRQQTPAEPFGPSPDLTVDALTELTAELV